MKTLPRVLFVLAAAGFVTAGVLAARQKDEQSAKQLLLDLVRQEDLTAVAQRAPNHSVADLNTALLVAARIGNRPIARLLLDRGADPNTGAGGPGETPLVAATLDGDWRMISLLLGRGADPNARSGIDGYETPLLYAAGHCHISALQVLLAGKADPNTRFGLDKEGQFARDRSQGPTPLMIAARAGHFACMETLVKAGADPTARDQAGFTPGDYLEKFLEVAMPRAREFLHPRKR